MMNKKVFNEMQRVVKTGNVVKELARIELSNNKEFTVKEINQIINGCNINIITRKDIDFQKALAKNKEYQELQNQVHVYCNKISIGEDLDINKRKLLKTLNNKDVIYNKIKKQFHKIK